MVLCQGKFFWDLYRGRKVEPIELVRVEEVYPFHEAELREALGRHEDAEVVWAQEEPENMGSWHFRSGRAAASWAWSSESWPARRAPARPQEA